jgi:hypothetical protein
VGVGFIAGLTSDAVFGNSDDVVLTTLDRSAGLSAEGAYEQSASVTFPQQIDGLVRLFARTDSGNAVLEPDTRANNLSAPRELSLTAPFADLSSTRLSFSSSSPGS